MNDVTASVRTVGRVWRVWRWAFQRRCYTDSNGGQVTRWVRFRYR